MLNSARQIIANVPGKHLDPMLLVRSQSKDSQGYVLITYEIQLRESSRNPIRFFDLIFFRGPEITECVRMGSDIRFKIAPDAALSTFHSINREGGAFIHLFEVPEAIIERFRLTLTYAPCLIVPIDKLASKALRRLLEATGCQKGIIECSDFSAPLPSIHLTNISSTEDISNFRPPFKRGRILVYDVASNEDLIEERSASRSTFSDRQTAVPVEEKPKGSEAAHVFVRSSSDVQDPFLDDAPSPEDVREAEQFSTLIKQILESSSQNIDSPSPPLKRRESESHGRETKPTRPTRSHSEKPAPEPQSPRISEFTNLFERSFRTFRQQLSEIMGSKADEAIDSATRKIQAQSPDFRLESLSDETAAAVIDLIELMSVDAPFLKRTRIRQAALILVADLYNKHYELLEKHHAIEKVEQTYYRLKK